MFCGKCGQSNNDGMRFCSECGDDLSRQTKGSRSDSTAGAGTGSGTDWGDTLDGLATYAPESLTVGQVLDGRYRLEEAIGAGGMGVVWRARDIELDMPVAVKVLPGVLSRNKRAISSLKVEAVVSLKLTHPNICRLHNFHADGNVKFLVMEYLEGQTLEAVLDERLDRKIPLAELRPIAKQIGEALDYAHSLNPPVLHRDIKPANIMIAPDGSAKLLDLGIAREIQDTMTQVTGKFDTAGTLPYMSPEQFRGSKMTTASDIYSLAAVLYECIAGKPYITPYGDPSYQILQRPYEEIEGQPANVNAALKSALTKSTNDRTESLEELYTMTGSTDAKAPAHETPKPKAVPAAPRAVAPARAVGSEEDPGEWSTILFKEKVHFSKWWVFCIGPLLPWVLAKASTLLRAHIDARLASPEFKSSRFQRPEGQKVIQLFRRNQFCSKKSARWIYGVHGLFLVAALVCLIIPVCLAPDIFNSEEVVEAMFEARGSWKHLRYRGRYVSTHENPVSPDLYRSTYRCYSFYRDGDYKDVDSSLPLFHASSLGIVEYDNYFSCGYSPGEEASGPRSDMRVAFSGDIKKGTTGALFRLENIRVSWNTSEGYGVAMYCMLCGYVLTSSFGAMLFWSHFSKHRNAELLLRAYSTDDVALIEKHKLESWRQEAGYVFLAVTMLNLVIFPWQVRKAFLRHDEWEKEIGLDSTIVDTKQELEKVANSRRQKKQVAK